MEKIELMKGAQINCKQGIFRDKIRREILNQTYETQLPGLRTLAEKYNVNIKTIRKSINPLINEGLISIEKGKGILVVKKPRHYYIGIVADCQERIFWKGGYTQRVFKHILEIIDNKGDCFSYQRKNVKQNYADLFKKNFMINGLLIFAPHNEERKKLLAFWKSGGVPFIAVGMACPGTGINFVDSDNLIDSYFGVRNLVEMGHEKIVFISDQESSPAHASRLAGYQKALREAQIPFNDSLVLMKDPDTKEFAAKLKKTFEKSEPPTAVFGASFRAAKKTSEILDEDKRKRLTALVYDDVDFDLQPLFGHYGIICQPYREIGEVAIEKLYQLMTSKTNSPVQIQMKSQVIFPK